MHPPPRPDWTVYARSTDPRLHPLGLPPVPRDAAGRAVSALSWITGLSPDHGVVRTLCVHTATGQEPADVTTWRYTGAGEPSLSPAHCLARDLRYHAGPTPGPEPSEEPFPFGGATVRAITARVAGMTWRSFALDDVTATLAHHAGADGDDPSWERR